MRKKLLIVAVFLIQSVVVTRLASALTITSGPTFTGVGVTTATVSWTTDVPADSWVFWGVGTSSLTASTNFQTYDPAMKTSHSMLMTGLLPGTTYVVFAWAKSAGVNGGVSAVFTAKMPDPTAPVAFDAVLSGSHHVYPGGGLLFTLTPYQLSGPRTGWFKITWGNLPAGLTLGTGNYIVNFLNTGAYPVGGRVPLYLQVSPTTAPNSYALPLIVTQNGVAKSYNYTVIVDPLVPLTKTALTGSPPPIPYQSDWESVMISTANRGGKFWCNKDLIYSMGTWTGGIWFYDGERNYYQIADYTLDPQWNTCAGWIQDVYRTSLLAAGGGEQAYLYQPDGLTMNYFRTGDALSKLAVGEIVQKDGGASYWYATTSGSFREVSWLLRAQLDAQTMGLSPIDNANEPPEFTANQLMSFIGQISEVPPAPVYYEPFFVGLAMESLISYYETTHDPRAALAVKAAADAIWAHVWSSTYSSFSYDNTAHSIIANGNLRSLNLLIAPAYAWLWAMTGDDKYRQEGDAIFAGGMMGVDAGQDWLPKTYTQSYRWSFDYIKWRLHPDLVAPNPGHPAWVPTLISSVTTSVNANTATIHWTTNNPSDTSVEYDTATLFYRYLTPLDKTPVLQHAVTLSNLPLGSTTFFQVQSRDAQNVLAVLGGFSLTPGQSSMRPVITSPNSVGGSVNKKFSFLISATNNPTSFGATGLPPGLNVFTSSGMISGLPTTPGVWVATVTATNAYGTGSAPLTFSIAASTPVITSPPTISVTQGIPFSYQITATGYPYIYYVTGDLVWGTQLNSATGELTGVITSTTSQVFHKQVEARNALGTGTAPLDIIYSTATVSIPVITSALSANAVVNFPFNYQITAANYPTSFDASGLPPNVNVNWTSGLISGVPISSGVWVSTITAINHKGTGKALLQIVVTGSFAVPVINSPNSAAGSVGSPFSYQISAINFPSSFNASGLPPGLSVDPGSGLISGTPTAPGVSNITISATNSGGTGTGKVTLTITVGPVNPTGNLTLNLPQFTPLNSQISANYTGSDQPSGYQWTFTPVNSIPQVIGSGGQGTGSALGGNGVAASLHTQSPTASMAAVQLALASYLVQVQVYNSQGLPATQAQAYTTFVPGDLGAVRVFPNPWRSDRSAGVPITFDNLSLGSSIKIFTLSGHGIRSLGAPVANGGNLSVTWDRNDDSGDKVASGLYFYLITDSTGNKKRGQLAILK